MLADWHSAPISSPPSCPEKRQELGGKDVTEEFYELHRHDVLSKYERLKA